MDHRLEPLIGRIYDEHREFLAHGAGIPIRRVPVDAGTVAICGDRAALDRRGRHAVTYVRPDQRLVILDLVDAADEAEHCAQYQHAELADLEPYTVLFRGKLRQFQATTKSFLMGVCDCGDATILVSGLDGGLAFNIRTKEGWTCVLEPRPSWTTPMDLDAELGGRHGRASKPRARARAGHEPSARPRARARHVEEFDDEVREHHARLCQGVTAESDGLELLEISFKELSREARLPHDCFEGNHKSRKDLDAVVAGLLYAVACGCGNLGGRESDMLAQLRRYGVVLPPGALSGVLRLFYLLGCPLVSQPKLAKDRKFSKRWNLDVMAALDMTNPKHLEWLRSIRTPLHPRVSVEPQGREDRDADEPRKSPASASDPQARERAEGRPPASEPGDEAGVGADPSAKRARSTVLPEPLLVFMQLALGALTLLAQQVTMLHQRVEATELAAREAVRSHVEMTTTAEEHGEPAASADADPPPGADVVSTARRAELKIDLNAATTQSATPQARGQGETAAAAVDQRPGPDERNANTSPRGGDERDETVEGVDAELSVEPPSGVDLVSTATGADPVARTPIENDVHDDMWPEHTDSPSHAVSWPHEVNIVPLPKERTLTLDRWNFATVMFLVMFELKDPCLVRLVVLKVIAWMTEPEERVELTSATLWPRALNLPGAHPQVAGLACAERLNAAQAWVPAQVELVDAGPRGPPRLGGSPLSQWRASPRWHVSGGGST